MKTEERDALERKMWMRVYTAQAQRVDWVLCAQPGGGTAPFRCRALGCLLNITGKECSLGAEHRCWSSWGAPGGYRACQSTQVMLREEMWSSGHDTQHLARSLESQVL